jgi:hypothetical protein
MARFWVHLHEKHAFHIVVEAPSREAAETWAYDHGMEFVYSVAREDDEVISADVDSVEEMLSEDAEREIIEVRVNAKGEEETP